MIQASNSSISRSSAIPSLTRPHLIKSFGLFLVVALLLLAADIWFLSRHQKTYDIPIGNYRDEAFLEGSYEQEAESNGTTYRWTMANATLEIGQVGVSPNPILELQLGGRPQVDTVQLLINQQPWTNIQATVEPRTYRMLLPPNLQRDTTIGIQSPTFRPDNDQRRLGIKLEHFRIIISGSALPMPTIFHYLSQLALVGFLHLTLIRLGFSWRIQALVTIALSIGLALILSNLLIMAHNYLFHLAVAAGLLAGLTWLLLPHAERKLDWLGTPHDIRLFWAIMVVACVIRLLGMLYPTFDGQDLGRNVRRQLMSLFGQMYIFSGSAEFARGQTIYPTGPYLFMMPGILVSYDIGNLIETVLTILEGSTTFLVAMLARRFGGSRDAALIASLLFLGSYSSFSVHVYQFSAQIFGQWLTAPIALILLANTPHRPTFRQWGFAILVLMFGVYSHIGVAILGISWMGMMLLLSIRRGDVVAWKAFALFVTTVLVAAFFMYLNIIAGTLQHTSQVLENEAGGALLPGARPLFFQALVLGYSLVGTLLIPFGLYLLFKRQPSLDQLIVPLGALLTVLFYIVVYLILRLQVRYFFFALPFVTAWIALALDWLAQRGYTGRLVSYGVTLLVITQMMFLWFDTVVANGQISMTPLTH